MNILVTGGCGFVGAAICRRLLACREGVRLTVLDSLRRAGAEANRDALAAAGVRVVHGDVRLASDFEGLAGAFDWVIDAAAEPSVLAGTGAAAGSGGGATSRQLLEHNLIGTIHLLEAAARWRAGVVLLSTSRVYSIPALAGLPLRERQGPYGPAYEPEPPRDGAASQGFGAAVAGLGPAGISEAFPTTAPVSLYGATKLASETLALEYAHRHGTPLFVNRCGVMAGAGQFGRADQGIFSWWIRQWRERRPLAYIGFGGRGLQVRDCLHPDDLADLLLIQMACESRGPSTVNVSGGAGSAMSLAELSGWCTQRLGPHTVSVAGESRPYDLPWVVLDHAAATSGFGWRPSRSVESILEEIVVSELPGAGLRSV
jgi:CDP-paratose 2-epimerase